MTDSTRDTMPRRRIIAPIAVVLAITLVTGAIHGILSQRWGPVPDLLAAADRLKGFPQQFGDWELVNQQQLDESTVQMLSCAGYVNRQYINRKTGETVSIAILLGPPGPIAVHTPEVCYSSRAYAIQEQRRQVTVEDSLGHLHTFWLLTFRSDTPTTDQLRVCYAWCGKKTWEASSSPRFEFAGQPFLLKIQLAAHVPPARPDQVPTAGGPCEDFLSAMLRSGWNING